MVLNHLAAILFFSGPLVYLGLFMAVDPAAIAALPRLLVRAFKNFGRTLSGLPSGEANPEAESGDISRRLRTALRLVGVVLLLFAVVV